MDINELNKKQLVLVTLLSTFVVSIGTGIITVSLMNEAPKSVPQTINNVIQKKKKKVSTNDGQKENQNKNLNKQDNDGLMVDENLLVSIFKKDSIHSSTSEEDKESKSIGQGLVISDNGLVLVDSSLLNKENLYTTNIGGKDFNLTILKKFDNGLSVVKMTNISEKNTDKEIDKSKNQ